MNRDRFFAAARASVFKGSLKQSQVDACNAILTEAEAAGAGLRETAYMLATARWEPGEDMAPKEEGLFYSTAARIRAVWPTRFPSAPAAAPYVKNPRALANKVYNGRMGNRLDSDDGWTFRGRGLAQITGRDNYGRAATKLSLPLVEQPELALRLDVAAKILVRGMMEGWFAGKSSAAMALTPGYEDDRAIINGSDQAAVIAAIARQFEAALAAGGWGDTPPAQPAPAPDPALVAALDWMGDAPDPAAFDAWRAVNAWMERRPS